MTNISIPYQMQDKHRQLITDRYGLQITQVTEAPRQFVAETWFITAGSNRYFVKVVDKPIFIPEIIRSLPVLDAMHNAGLKRISHPIKTVDGELAIMDQTTLIVLYNAIDAVQSEEYDENAFGRTLAEIHAITPQIDVAIPTEDFQFPYRKQYAAQWQGMMLRTMVKDDITSNLREVLTKYRTRIEGQYKRFNILMPEMQKLDHEMVITHGDAGGNTLVKAPDDLHIIDWDGILLAPPERDMWIPGSEFMKGYQTVRPKVTPNPLVLEYYTLNYYFQSMVHHMSEIISTKEPEHRKKNVEQIESNLIEGWIVPFLQKFNLY